MTNINEKLPIEQQDSAPPTTSPKIEKKDWNGYAIITIVTTGIGIAAVLFFALELTLYVKNIAAEKFSSLNIESAKEKIKEKGLTDLLGRVEKIKSFDSGRVIKRMALCTEHEEKILKSLQDRFTFTDDQLEQMLMGAHVFLEDGGKTYNEWKALPAANPGISSHPSNGQEQFRMQGTLVSELLFSSFTDENTKKTYTWFQLENHPLTIGHITLHMVDFAKYWISRFNQGPYGMSSFTHDCPMCISERSTTE